MNIIKKKLLQEYMPFILLLLFIGILHFLIGNFDADDAWFEQVLEKNGMGIFEYVKYRFYEWTSRIVIEPVLIIMTKHVNIWRILDTIFYTSIPFFVSRTFRCSKMANWILCFFAVVFPFCMFVEAGWIATSTNYLWPLWCATLVVFVLSKYYRKEAKINVAWYALSVVALIYACNAEQCAALLFVVISLFVIQTLRKGNKKLIVFPIILLVIDLASLLFILLCPGNANRVLVEIQSSFPSFNEFNFFERITLGIVNGYRRIFFSDELICTCVLVGICILVYMTQRKKYQMIFPLIPLFLNVGFYISNNSSHEKSFPEANDFLLIIFPTIGDIKTKGEMNGAFWLLFVYGIITIICLLVSLFTIYRKDGMRMIFNGVILLTGVGTVAIIGLSPSVYASLNRITMYCIVCMVFVVVGSYTFLEKNSMQKSVHVNGEKSKSINYVLVYCSIFIAFLSYACNVYGILQFNSFVRMR